MSVTSGQHGSEPCLPDLARCLAMECLQRLKPVTGSGFNGTVRFFRNCPWTQTNGPLAASTNNHNSSGSSATDGMDHEVQLMFPDHSPPQNMRTITGRERAPPISRPLRVRNDSTMPVLLAFNTVCTPEPQNEVFAPGASQYVVLDRQAKRKTSTVPCTVCHGRHHG